MAGGRPTKYNQQILVDTREYLENYEQHGDAIPSIAGLSVVLGLPRQTIYDWARQEEKEEFSDILQSILSTQEKVLINKGLKNEFNSNITKLALGKHGYSDKQETDVTSKGEQISTFNDEQIATIAERIAKGKGGDGGSSI